MHGSTSSTTDLTALQAELHAFVRDELAAGQGLDSIAPDEDLIKLGLVDSVGVQQLVDLCESGYGIRVTEDDLLPENFQTIGALAEFVERKRATPLGEPEKRGLWSRKR